MIYLDNSATTALSTEVKSAMTAAMESYGNPSSLHSLGDLSRRELTRARTAVMTALEAKNGKLIFTSCGSEASNLAILGCVASKERRPANRIVTTDSEHPSVENVMAQLASQGFEIVRIPTKGGELDPDALERSLEKPIYMVSMMMVNNETGAVYMVGDYFKRVKDKYPEAVCHTDAVQGFLKVGFTPITLSADMITLSAHKIHGPKGVGALWVSDRIIKERRLAPTLLGGGQEDGFRSGTENTVGIAGFAAAAEQGARTFVKDITHIADLHAYAREKLSALGEQVQLNIPPLAAAHILSVTVKGIKSQTTLNYLSGKGICVSSGSACSSHSNKPSRVLLAYGLSERDADSTLRVSLSRYNTKEDIDALAAALAEATAKLVRMKR